jgi:signal transduction histidine kinase
LDLAIVKRIIESLEGSIIFESETNEGTKFIVVLPPAREPSN